MNQIDQNFAVRKPLLQIDIDQMNQTNQIDQTNQINQTNQIDQTNQINQTNQTNQINQIDQKDQKGAAPAGRGDTGAAFRGGKLSDGKVSFYISLQYFYV